MNILHLSLTDLVGGASRAGYRIHRAQVDNGMSSQFFTLNRTSADPTVLAPTSKGAKFCTLIRSNIENLLVKSLLGNTENPCSLNRMPFSQIPQSYIHDADIINLHFVAGALLPVSLRPLRGKRIVWTLHDMWAFGGIEHYTRENDAAMWRTGAKAVHSMFDSVSYTHLTLPTKA